MYMKGNNAFEKKKKMTTLAASWRPVWRTAADQVSVHDEPLHSQAYPQKDGTLVQMRVHACP